MDFSSNKGSSLKNSGKMRNNLALAERVHTHRGGILPLCKLYFRCDYLKRGPQKRPEASPLGEIAGVRARKGGCLTG